MTTATKQTERSEAIQELKKYIKEGDTVYTVLRHVSRSGMMRHIDLFVFRDNEPFYISYSAAKAIGWTRRKDGAIKVSGCGMDMGFHVVHTLGEAVFGDGYKLNHRWL